MAGPDIPTREEFVARFTPVKFRYDASKPSDDWTRWIENTNATQFQIIMPWGTIPIPNFYATYYDFVTTHHGAKNFLRHNLAGAASIFDGAAIKFSSAPYVANVRVDEYFEGQYACNVLTGEWVSHRIGASEVCSELLWMQEINRLQAANKALKERVVKLETMLTLLRSRSQTIDEIVQRS